MILKPVTSNVVSINAARLLKPIKAPKVKAHLPEDIPEEPPEPPLNSDNGIFY